MIRATKRSATMLHQVVTWRSILTGFALAAIIASVVTVCIGGHTDTGTGRIDTSRTSAEPAAAPVHEHPPRQATGRETKATDVGDVRPSGKDPGNNCCAQHAPPAIDAAAQRPEAQHHSIGHETAAADPSRPVPPSLPVAPVHSPPVPSLIQLSISRT